MSVFSNFTNPTDNDSPDLTNLIDPMVLLSALMMLLLPAMQSLQLHDINLAETDGGGSMASADSPVVVSFDANGRIYFDEKTVNEEELQRRLGELPPESTVVVAGDQLADFGFGIQLVTTISKAGLNCQGLTLKERK